LREEPLHDEARLLPIAILEERCNNIPIRRAVPEREAGEEADKDA
jgi:hypothetical protein